MEVTFEFEAELFEWDARDDSSWVFVHVPLEISDEIDDIVPTKRGFGSVRVKVRCGTSAWATSVFPDKGSGCYALPLKKQVRKAQGLECGDVAAFELSPVID